MLSGGRSVIYHTNVTCLEIERHNLDITISISNIINLFFSSSNRQLISDLNKTETQLSFINRNLLKKYNCYE